MGVSSAKDLTNTTRVGRAWTVAQREGKSRSRTARRESWLGLGPFVLPLSTRRIYGKLSHAVSTKRLYRAESPDLSGWIVDVPTLPTKLVALNPSNHFAIPLKSIPVLLAFSGVPRPQYSRKDETVDTTVGNGGGVDDGGGTWCSLGCSAPDDDERRLTICGVSRPYVLVFSIISLYQESLEDIWPDMCPSGPAISVRPDQIHAVLLMKTM